MGVGCSLHSAQLPSGPQQLRVICGSSVVSRGQGPDSLFSSPESHPPHKVAQERGGRRLWQQEDRRRAAGCGSGLPAVQGDPSLARARPTSVLGRPLPWALMGFLVPSAPWWRLTGVHSLTCSLHLVLFLLGSQQGNTWVFWFGLVFATVVTYFLWFQKTQRRALGKCSCRTAPWMYFHFGFCFSFPMISRGCSCTHTVFCSLEQKRGCCFSHFPVVGHGLPSI